MLPNRATHHKYYFWKIFKIRELEKLEFAKSRAKRAYVVCVPTCLRASVVYVPTCQKRCQLLIFTCQRANKRANVLINVPTHHTACQCFKLACQRVKRRATFSNILLTKCYGKFLYFIIKKNFYIILDIIVIHIMCI